MGWGFDDQIHSFAHCSWASTLGLYRGRQVLILDPITMKSIPQVTTTSAAGLIADVAAALKICTRIYQALCGVVSLLSILRFVIYYL